MLHLRVALFREQDWPEPPTRMTRIQITIMAPPPDRPAARPRSRRASRPVPASPGPTPEETRSTRRMASQPGRDWAGRDLADLLGIKPRNMLTQLAEWTRLGFLAKPARAGTRCPARPAPPLMPDRNP